jgi:hypothetical protein
LEIFTSLRRCGGDEVGKGRVERVGLKKSILMGERRVYFLCLDFIEGFGV